jgi:hypothetical protein
MKRKARKLGAGRNTAAATAAAEKLDAMNAGIRQKRDPGEALRRQMEAQINAKSRQRRGRETSASQALSGALGKRKT